LGHLISGLVSIEMIELGYQHYQLWCIYIYNDVECISTLSIYIYMYMTVYVYMYMFVYVIYNTMWFTLT
jgi:hypothetical protein